MQESALPQLPETAQLSPEEEEYLDNVTKNYAVMQFHNNAWIKKAQEEPAFLSKWIHKYKTHVAEKEKISNANFYSTDSARSLLCEHVPLANFLSKTGAAHFSISKNASFAEHHWPDEFPNYYIASGSFAHLLMYHDLLMNPAAKMLLKAVWKQDHEQTQANAPSIQSRNVTAFVTGGTGAGKSYTIRRLLNPNPESSIEQSAPESAKKLGIFDTPMSDVHSARTKVEAALALGEAKIYFIYSAS